MASTTGNSSNVRIWSIHVYKGSRRTTYSVRWLVAGGRHRRTFVTRKLAESFHATLIRAVRDGVEFRLLDGLPSTVRSSADRISWYAHAVAFVDMKWRDASPKHRKGIAEALVTVTTAAAGDTPNWLSERDLRHALMAWSFNSTARAAGGQSADPLEEIHKALLWVAKHSPTLSEVSDPVRLRSLLEATARRLDGIAASPSTAARKRSAFYSCLAYAVELGHLEANPLDRLKWKRSAQIQTVDRRVVVNPSQARMLLGAVAEAHPELEAFFACIYYAGLRPAEARFLRDRDCALPEDGWGELLLVGSTPAVSAAWTDGAGLPDRPLKHRARTEVRRVPAPPELVRSLRIHIGRFKLGRDGRLFVARTGRAGVPLSPPYDTPVSMGPFTEHGSTRGPSL